MNDPLLVCVFLCGWPGHQVVAYKEQKKTTFVGALPPWTFFIGFTLFWWEKGNITLTGDRSKIPYILRSNRKHPEGGSFMDGGDESVFRTYVIQFQHADELQPIQYVPTE